MGVVYGVRLASTPEFRYVGITTAGARRRFGQHVTKARNGIRTPFYDWLRKHEHDDVVWEVLETVRTDLHALGEAEIVWISLARSAGHRLLNVSEGGLGPTGVVWTPAQREAARLRSLGRKGASRPGALNPFYGGRHSEAQRRRWSETRRGTNVGPDNANYGLFGPAHPSYGHTMSDEARRALSEARTGPGNPNYGRSASAETRAKRSAAQKGVPKPSSARSAHTRYHTNKGVVSLRCRFCSEAAPAASTIDSSTTGDVQSHE
ncbi:NUMOD3 domain-containing DNA-binding protein [Cellulomonas sp. NPDC055163]